MSWVADVHGSQYNDRIGYYKAHEDVSDFESDNDFKYDKHRKKYIKKAAKKGYYQTHDVARPSDDVLQYERRHRKYKDVVNVPIVDATPMRDQLDQQRWMLDNDEVLQKRLAFFSERGEDGELLRQRDFRAFMKLATVVSVGALSLVGVKLVMDFIVQLSKE